MTQLKTNISFKKLEEILETLNPRVIKNVKITLSSSCSSDIPFRADIEVSCNTYTVTLGDMDDRYWNDTISYFFDTIRESKINYTCNDYKQQTCYGEKIWCI